MHLEQLPQVPSRVEQAMIIPKMTLEERLQQAREDLPAVQRKFDKQAAQIRTNDRTNEPFIL